MADSFCFSAEHVLFLLVLGKFGTLDAALTEQKVSLRWDLFYSHLQIGAKS
jgi:hypothetical protein